MNIHRQVQAFEFKRLQENFAFLILVFQSI